MARRPTHTDCVDVCLAAIEGRAPTRWCTPRGPHANVAVQHAIQRPLQALHGAFEWGPLLAWYCGFIQQWQGCDVSGM